MESGFQQGTKLTAVGQLLCSALGNSSHSGPVATTELLKPPK
jgi:hypothetical protein